MKSKWFVVKSFAKNKYSNCKYLKIVFISKYEVFCLVTECHRLAENLVQVSERALKLSANVCWLDRDTETWEVETELPAQRSHHCLAVLGGFIFAAGGSSSRGDGDGAACKQLYRYDPRHRQWTQVPGPVETLFLRRAEAVTTVSGG